MSQINQIQVLLADWGNFWSDQEKGAGWGSNSVTGRMCDALRTGIFASGTAHMVADKSDSISVPARFQDLDVAITQLSPSERKWIVIKYKRPFKTKVERAKRMTFTNLFIARGEHKILGLLG